ncbi:hypothetical protein QAO71_16925 (plasmid) [Halopseudomonas sp. SMJS2]|uniref:hypothetical protein n=1 Tax=Halopseudomonas sp. SMJS2 TaxID=3041098 RepID=UPI002453198D|nr:hypothetical protein [Halopseudomonas sp. SMJS2]WGK63454.1 hypothetical protein QAO71_16925 [Halopseudomonas sp. SMJS2]
MGMQEQEPEFLPFDFVYAGRRALKGNKPGAEIFRIVDGWLADSFVFASKSLKGNVIGGVYRGAQFTDSQARSLGAVTFVERWKDQLACIDWRAVMKRLRPISVVSSWKRTLRRSTR